MPPRAVGLDIGSHAVRAAELRMDGVPHLRAFGQVGLPRGAVEAGEVVDPGAVAAALRRLWREARIRDRRVRLGLANLRTIVRQVEMPALPEEELRSALEFQAEDFIPLPIEETQLDFSVLESFESDEGEPMVRVLIAAAHRPMLENALVAVREAGLQAVAIDLVPFALVRAVGTTEAPAAGGPEPGGGVGTEDAGGGEPPTVAVPGAQAIVSVGSGVTVVVVHELGIPRFVRIVAAGSDSLTTAIEQGLGIPFDEAELLKRQLGEPVERRDEALQALQGPLVEIVNEIRGSIEFYVSQPGARPVGEVLLTGGGSLLVGFVERLAETLALPVRMADPLARLTVGDIGFAPEEVELLRPYLGVPVGLALGGARVVPHRIDLLPAKERPVVAGRRLVVVGGSALAALVTVLAVLTMARSDQIAEEEDRLAAQERRNADLQAQIAALRGAEELKTQADQGNQLVAQALASEVSWSRILEEVARVIPSDVWLESFAGNVSPSTTPGAPISGSASFTAVGSDFPSTAAWLQRIATIPAFRSIWVSQLSRGRFTEGGVSADVVNFSSTMELTDAARSERAREAQARSAASGSPAQPSPQEGTGDEGSQS